MEPIYGNYLGIVINNEDPEERKRVQVFIPHLSNTLFSNWNNRLEDFAIRSPLDLGDKIVTKLKQLLPWAEAAAPIFGGSTGMTANTVSKRLVVNNSGYTFPAGTGGLAIDPLAEDETLPPVTPPQGGEFVSPDAPPEELPVFEDYEGGDVTAPLTSSSNGEIPQTSNGNLNLTSGQKYAVDSFLKNYSQNLGSYQAVSDNLRQQGIILTPSQIAAIQWREASGDLTKSIANGQSLGTNVRKDGRLGQGSSSNSFTPTKNWVSNTTEVLSYKINEKYGSTSGDFSSASRFNDFAERFNGLGYRNRGLVSPYVYSGTTLYESGKFVADGVFNPSVKDKQVGTAVLVSAADGTIDTTSFETSQDRFLDPQLDARNENIGFTPNSLTSASGSPNGNLSVPNAGAKVLVFFYGGDIQKPVYFASAIEPTT